MNKQPPNILFIMTDQHRLDHVGWHPQPRMTMPNLDRLAEGHVFQNCISVHPVCMPARSALLTGRYPHQVGALSMSGDLSRQIPTYAQALQQAGYHTAGIGKFHWLQTWKWSTGPGQGVDLANLHEELKGYGFDEVWEATGKQLAIHNRCDWCVQLEKKGILEEYRRFAHQSGTHFGAMTAQDANYTCEPWPFDEEDYVDVATATQAIQSLRERPDDKPYFGFISFCGPHPPFDPPPRFLEQVEEESDEVFVSGAAYDAAMDDETIARMRRARRSYRAMLRCLDEQIGRLWEELDRQAMWDNTVIIFTTDHGEMLGDYGFFGKQRPLWQAVTVPTAVRHPSHLDGRSCDSVIELTDLTATILDIAGLDPKAALAKDWPAFNDRIPCRSLMPVIRGEAERVRDYAFSECDARWNMIQDERYKYVRYPADDDASPAREELYDVKADPDCLDNLAGNAGIEQVLAPMRERLLHILSTTPAAQTRWAPLMKPDGSREYPLD